MPRTSSIMGLHLCYRLWIAEMNSDITVLRIFDDYIKELSRQNEPKVKNKIRYFQQQFVNFRKEIDELRDAMHILKMELAAHARGKKPVDHKAYKTDNHMALKKSYSAFREKFEKVKKEFIGFQSEWLD
jgi:hypothetical protein